VRIVKLAGEQRYLARSRTVERGAYFELTVSPWGQVRCASPGFAYRGVCKHAAALKARLSQPASPSGSGPATGLRVFRPNVQTEPGVEHGLAALRHRPHVPLPHRGAR
jgi:hypothetical protein